MLLTPDRIWPAVRRQSRHALETGALVPIATSVHVLEEQGLRFAVRRVERIAASISPLSKSAWRSELTSSISTPGWRARKSFRRGISQRTARLGNRLIVTAPAPCPRRTRAVASPIASSASWTSR